MANTEKIRNVVLVGHRGSGKTSLVDAMLFATGATNRLGRVSEGTSTTDFDEDEKARQLSINLGVAFCDWNGCHVNLLDAPGDADFLGEAISAMRVADAALVVLNASVGVEVETEKVWALADQYGRPRMVVVNRMDSERANFEEAVSSLQDHFGGQILPLQVPLGAESGFRGMVDVLRLKAYETTGSLNGKLQEVPIPAELAGIVGEYRERLLEAAAETEDALIEKYLEGEELTQAELERGLRTGTLRGSVVPVLCCSAGKNVGSLQVLEYVTSLLPSPLDLGPVEGRVGEDTVTREPVPTSPFSALVFKTVEDRYGTITYFRVFSGRMTADTPVFNATKKQRERLGQLFYLRGKEQTPVSPVQAGDIAAVAKLNVTDTGDTLCVENNPVVYEPPAYPEPAISLAIHPKSREDEEKISAGLARLQREDRSLHAYRNEETRELIIAGMGQRHLEIVVDRLKAKYDVDVTTSPPKVAYRETIQRPCQARYRHKKQTGGAGQFGEVELHLEPLARGEGFEFVDQIVGGVIPQAYRPSVEKGVLNAMRHGPLAGYQMVDIRVRLVDGKDHPVDSSDIAFQLAGENAFRQALGGGSPVLLEPIYDLEVMVPDEYLGEVMGDLSGRRGQIMGTDQRQGLQVVQAKIPLAEMVSYATDLRSMTQGRGRHRSQFSHYQEVPGNVAERVIAQRRAELEEEKK